MSQAEEIAALRRREASHLDSVDSVTLTALLNKIEFSLDTRYGIKDPDSIYACGSWVRGDAIPGMSDLDIRVVVQSWDNARDVFEEAREWFKNEWSPENCPYPFLYVDLVIWGSEPEPDGDFILLVEPGREGGR